MYSPHMSSAGRVDKWVMLAVALIGALAAWFSQRNAGKSPSAVPADRVDGSMQEPAGASFDFYLMAMTVHPAFCADNGRRRECTSGNPRLLVIHGLWPERMEPRTYPHDCPVPALDLEPALARELEDMMPGMADGLDRHEWRTHGGCSGLDDDDYYRHALDLARRVDGALTAALTTRAGGEATAAELRSIADRFSAGLGRTLTFHCRTLRGSPGGRPYLLEVRQCVDNDGPGGAPGTALDCAAVKRRDQGCGDQFLIARENTR
jgi:ribonuclease I